jgi:X-X-X-Leu-X-X-Gly heptad repeat protein
VDIDEKLTLLPAFTAHGRFACSLFGRVRTPVAKKVTGIAFFPGAQNGPRDGVGKVREGVGKVRKGVGKVREGVGKVRDGVGKVREGVGKVREGVGKVREGVGKVREGVGKVRDGDDIRSCHSRSDVSAVHQTKERLDGDWFLHLGLRYGLSKLEIVGN